MKTIFGFFSCALAGATTQSIAAAANSDQAVMLNLRFFMTDILPVVGSCDLVDEFGRGALLH
jgi:hypothetical protein